MYSGGIGSWAAAKRVAEEYGTENLTLLFTDTLVEDRDLYRFLIETAAEINGTAPSSAIMAKCQRIPDVESDGDVALRKELLPEIAADAMCEVPLLAWIADGRTPWEVFKDVRFIGNSRLAQCSHVLKQEMAAKWVSEHYPLQNGEAPEVTLYLGIDWTEEHRTKAPIKNWSPYTVNFPMCSEPFLDKHDTLRMLDRVSIKQPRLYEMGFSHNNCSGACVRAGQGHWAKVYEQMPKAYRYQERKEQEMRDYLGKDVSILKQVRDKVTYRLTLTDLRSRIEGKCDIDRDDIGGCGCFVTYDGKGDDSSDEL